MGLFDSVRDLVGGEDADADQSGVDRDVTPADGRREPSPTAFRNNAVDAVQQWTEYDLDFSLPSLSRLDDLARKQGAALDVVAADRGEEAAAERHVAYTVRAGSYLGEVLVRERDGEWVRDGDDWRVRIDGEEIDVFAVASHSFSEAPAFGEVADRLREDTDDATAETEGAAGTDGPDPDDLAEYAEELASVYGEYDLDFSPASLSRLGALADTEWDRERFADAEVGGEDIESGMYTQLVRQLGSYYGEVLVREHGGEWTRHGSAFAVRVSGDEGRTAVAEVFAVARDSLTGPAQFAADYDAVTDEAGVGAADVAESAAAVPTEDEGSDGDCEGDSTAADPGESADDGGSAPDSRSTAPVGGATDEPAAATRSPEPSDPDPADGEARSARCDRADGDTDGDGFDVAAAAKRVVGDADGVADDGRGDEEPPGNEARDGPDAGTIDPETGADTDSGGPTDESGRGGSDEEEITLELSEEDGAETEGPTATEMSEEAAAFVATWPGYDLDFSPASLERLDRLIEAEYPDLLDRDPEFRRARAVEIGGYLGEVLRRAIDGEWVQSGTDPALYVAGPAGEHRFDPVAAARARFRGERTLAATYAAVRERVGGSD